MMSDFGSSDSGGPVATHSRVPGTSRPATSQPDFTTNIIPENQPQLWEGGHSIFPQAFLSSSSTIIPPPVDFFQGLPGGIPQNPLAQFNDLYRNNFALSAFARQRMMTENLAKKLPYFHREYNGTRSPPEKRKSPPMSLVESPPKRPRCSPPLPLPISSSQNFVTTSPPLSHGNGSQPNFHRFGHPMVPQSTSFTSPPSYSSGISSLPPPLSQSIKSEPNEEPDNINVAAKLVATLKMMSRNNDSLPEASSSNEVSNLNESDNVTNSNPSGIRLQVKKELDLCNPGEDNQVEVPVSKNEPENQTNDESDESSESSHKDSDCSGQLQNNSIDRRDVNILNCAVCDFSTESSIIYTDHVTTVHPNVCFDCKFEAENAALLFEHRKTCVIHIQKEEQASSAKNKSKSKKLVCKICKDIAANEEEFYKHRRIHISADKLLLCPHCCFVTQYKHHLDYHMKNHTGNKPFKCQQCEYSCVNKSMLNSHMKSHSNFYSYRCKDCNYEAKYMHALKCHCRKYGHNAQPVLNPDGTYNPYPIVDVYGTRRGPKVKRDADGNIIYPSQYSGKIALQLASNPVSTSPSATSSRTNTTTVSPNTSLPFPFMRDSPTLSPYPTLSALDSRLYNSRNATFNGPSPLMFPPSALNSPQSPSTSNPRHFLENLPNSFPRSDQKKTESPMDASVSCHACGMVLANPDLLHQHYLLIHVLPRAALARDMGTPPRAPPRLNEQTPEANANNFLSKILRLANPVLHPMQSWVPGMEPFTSSPLTAASAGEERKTEEEQTGGSPAPLDLTKDHTPPQQIIRRRRLSGTPPDAAASSLTPPDTCSPPLKTRRVPLTTNRRLENIQEEENSAPNTCQESPSQKTPTSSDVPIKTEVEVEEEVLPVPVNTENADYVQECSFCKITFRVKDMYMKHIAFHDTLNPLQCSFCKETQADSSSFFEHCFNCKLRHTINTITAQN